MKFQKIARGTLLSAALCGGIASSQASMIAVFGNNSVGSFLGANGNSVTFVSDSDLSTAGFLNSFDLFIYTRDGSSFGTSLSTAAAANVSAFVTGNVVLFSSDLADNSFPGDGTNTLLLNAVDFADNKGYIGEFTGSCAAMSSNSAGLTPLGLISGNCSSLTFGPGGDPMDILLNAHPVVQGVADLSSFGNSHEFFANLQPTDPSLIVAVNSAGIPSIVAANGTVPEPATLALLGAGLLGFGISRRK